MIKFLKQIADAGILLDVDNGKLKLLTKEKIVDESLLDEIKNNKEEIISYLIETGNLDIATEKKAKIPVVELQESYPLSAGQYRLWVLSQFKDGNSSYNMPSYSILNGEYNIPDLKRSIKSIIERHEILRTAFREDAHGLVKQVIRSTEEIGFEIGYIDYRQRANPEQEALEYVKRDSYKPFDLEKGPLFRVSLLQFSDSGYVLYYNMHHIISDGWSMDILSRDILSYYQHHTKGTTLNLPDLQIQYKDYAAWQSTQLETQAYKVHRTFWKNKLHGDIPILDLPTQKRRPPLKTFNGKRLSCSLNKKCTAEIRTYLDKNGGTMFMFLVASLKALFYRYTKQEDIIIGTPISGLTSFNDFYRNVKKGLLDSYTHQMYPFDKLVEELDVSRDISRNALFDVMIILQNATDRNQGFIEGSSTVRDNGQAIAKFDLTFTFREAENHIGLDLTYNTDVYEYDMIVRFLNHYQQLVEKICANSNAAIGALDYLSDSERTNLLYQFNDTKAAYPKDSTIIDFLAKQVEQTPEKIAAVYGNLTLTYKQLDEQSNQLANLLNSKYGIIKNDLVGVRLDRSLEMLIAILGIIKAGGAYVPLDMQHPEVRIRFIQNDSKYKLCIHQEFLAGFNAEKETNGKLKPTINIVGTDPIYVIYTSGSTGQPKGVLNAHEGLLNRLLWMRNDLGITQDDTILQKTPYTFDVSVWELLMPAITGCQLVFAQPEAHKNPKAIEELIKRNQVTIIHFVPSMLGIFLENLDPDNCRSLRHVVCSGEGFNRCKHRATWC